ncbi:hypothetical protein N9H39_01360 [Gammaproteobacteria bacterium]|nr:hypothetical protein [Gammaproteobacteria bacterium]
MMTSITHTNGPVADESFHEEKKEKICSMISECCAGMSANDKKKVMEKTMPRMMEMMGAETKGGIPGTGMMGMMMNHCMRAFRWFPLILITLGVVLFLLGYVLSAETVRAMWLVLAVVPILMGLFGFVMMSTMNRST